MPAIEAAERLTVLQSFPRPRPTTNPYLRLLVDALPPDADVRYFSWRTALTGRYDVFHVHWPENLLRRPGRLARLARRGALLALLPVLRLRRVAVVRTLHNTRPHEPSAALDAALLGRLDARTSQWIRLNAFTPTAHPDRTWTIPHGHYRSWFAGRPRPEVVPGRLLHFGLVRPYKGVEDLLAAFAALPDPRASLRIVGAASSAGLARAVTAATHADARVGARLEYVDDDALGAEVSAAELVVLPYRDMHNSGAALLALSLDRPVLVPASDVTAALAAEVGAGWVLLFEGPITAGALATALASVREGARSSSPDLSGREWPEAGEEHMRVYRAARRAARAGGRRGRRAGGRQPRTGGSWRNGTGAAAENGTI